MIVFLVSFFIRDRDEKITLCVVSLIGLFSIGIQSVWIEIVESGVSYDISSIPFVFFCIMFALVQVMRIHYYINQGELSD